MGSNVTNWLVNYVETETFVRLLGVEMVFVSYCKIVT